MTRWEKNRGSSEGRENKKKEEKKSGAEGTRRRDKTEGENDVTNRLQTDGHYLFKDIKAKVGGDNGKEGRRIHRRKDEEGAGGVRKDGESPRQSRSVMVVETAGSHLAKGQTGSEEEATGRNGGTHAHNSILQMTSPGSPTASVTSGLNTKRSK